MKTDRFLTAPFLAAMLILAAFALFGAPIALDPTTSGGLAALGLAAFGVTDAAAAATSPKFRIREDMVAFQNVVASGRASSRVPRYPLTLLRATLQLGGTTFTKSQITEIRLRWGAKTLYLVSGSDLDKINKYRGVFDDDKFLTVDFTQPKNKDKGGEFIGGIDLSTLPDGEVYLEVVTSGATAPTLQGKVTWGPPQANKLIAKMLQFTYAASVTGKNAIPLDVKGAAIQRLHFIYTGTSFAASAAATAWSTNTGNGAMGTITVSSGAKPGTYKLQIIEPAANAGTFIVTDPDGVPISAKGTVASAFSAGGLAFTLADGGTDFVAGDGFDIVVSSVSNGNVNRVEIKKDSRTMWDYECAQARFMQREYGHAPQEKMYVADFIADNWIDGLLGTSDAKNMEFNAWLTATDTLTIYADVLDLPENN